MAVLLIDASNMAYRAKYAYNLSNRGQDTSVTYGVIRMLMTLIRDQNPSGMVMCFDGGRPKYRQRLVPTYKNNRNHDDDPTHIEYLRQVAELYRKLPYFGIMCVKRDGIEADDLMYHASRMLECSKVVTNDDDLLQAVNDNTAVLKPTKKDYKEINKDNFFQEVGIDVTWYITAKAFMGDSSDNVPGVLGIGPATAAKMFADGYPELSRLNKNLRERVEGFISSGLFDAALGCICLENDLSGARATLLSAMWMPYQNKMVYKYCIENAFSSLIEAGSLGKIFGSLRKPEFVVNGWRLPRIWDADRYPLGA
jgi:DNA polymerase-1